MNPNCTEQICGIDRRPRMVKQQGGILMSSGCDEDVMRMRSRCGEALSL